MVLLGTVFVLGNERTFLFLLGGVLENDSLLLAFLFQALMLCCSFYLRVFKHFYFFGLTLRAHFLISSCIISGFHGVPIKEDNVFHLIQDNSLL